MPDSELIVVTTTSDQRMTLEKIATELVNRNLAACCQIGGPITSWYRWNGQVEQAEELTCTIKSTRANFDQIERLILKLHHYDQPQIIATPVTLVEPGYRAWVVDQCNTTDA